MLVVFVRSLILFLIVVIVMRIMGKRQIGQLQPFELAVAIMISELAAVPIQNTSIPLINGIIPIITLLIAQLLLSLISLKSIKGREIICGKPNILIENGKINQDNLKKEMYTLNDLLEQLRIKGTCNISDVEFAILETNGQLSIIQKSQKRPLTNEDIQLSTNYEGIPVDLVIDGKILYNNLNKINLDENWLRSELMKYNISEIKELFFVSIDTSGKLYYQTKSKKMEES